MNPILTKHIKSRFIKEFSHEPIIIKSPGRINLIGEHTDYNEGFAIPAAINKGIVTAIQKSTTDLCTVIANDLSETYSFSLKKIQSIQNGGWKNYVLGVVAEIQKKGITIKPFNLIFGGDIPIGAGLSSSAALENSIVFGLNELFSLGLSKKEMIQISQKAEHNYAGVKCGIMDQYASMFGIENGALLLDCRTTESSNISINFNEYQLLLINTNVKHSLSESAYNNRRRVCEKIASLLNVKALRDASEEDLKQLKIKISEEDYHKALYVIYENNRVLKAVKAIKNNKLLDFGKLLYETHEGLQKKYMVSCHELDLLVDKAKQNPAVIGARMMGGGFGGCTLNIVKKSELNSFTITVEKAYKEHFNKHCSFYTIEFSKGTHLAEE
ncbi:MAG: galactokinase [Lutibacter sp.]|uniref:galactokinase n=1 Tax=Lutibacter sp. TaxID=1925666 RepID=UPI00385D36D6